MDLDNFGLSLIPPWVLALVRFWLLADLIQISMSKPCLFNKNEKLPYRAPSSAVIRPASQYSQKSFKSQKSLRSYFSLNLKIFI